MQHIKLKKEPKIEAKQEAFPYQFETLEAIQDKEYAAIFHEQGLGKSKIAIDLMLYWLEIKEVDTILFVVKKGLINNWVNEFDLHSYIRPQIISQNKAANYYVFNSPSRLLLTHYEVLKSELERFKLFLKTRDVAVVLDESTKIKNPISALTKAIFALSSFFKKRIIMTGTPIANRPYDIWSQIWFLDQGLSLGNNFRSFKKEFDLTTDLVANEKKQIRFEDQLEEIFSKIGHFAVRQTKHGGIIKLPEKTIQTIMCEWEKIQYNLYRQIQKETRAIVVRDGIPIEDNSDEILKRMLRLVQVASNPRLIDESYSANPGKEDELMNIVSSICNNGEKCIVWTSFTSNVDWMTNELSSFGTCKVHGKLDMDRRNKAIKAFLEKDSKQVLVATPGAAKEGLTLTVANHVIFYDRTFS